MELFEQVYLLFISQYSAWLKVGTFNIRNINLTVKKLI